MFCGHHSHHLWCSAHFEPKRHIFIIAREIKAANSRYCQVNGGVEKCQDDKEWAAVELMAVRVEKRNTELITSYW